ncbi:MAG: hypothetical protein WA708_09675 [Acidobacteriaceae bacterium]
MTDYSVYLDDGGHPDGQPYLLVAGFAATVSQWLAFEPVWLSTLGKLGFGDVFHMTDFMSEKRSAFQEDRILSQLRRVIQSHTLRPFVSAIDMAAYKRVQNEFTLEESHGAPYALAGRQFVKELHEWQGQELGPEDHTLVFVEEGTKHYGDLEQVFKRDKLPIPNRVPKSMTQVQPADILAWEVFNFLRDGSPKRMRKNLEKLTRSIRKQQNFGGIFYEHDLRRLCNESIRVPPRDIIPPGEDPIRFGGGGDKKRVRRRTVY